MDTYKFSLPMMDNYKNGKLICARYREKWKTGKSKEYLAMDYAKDQFIVGLTHSL